MKKVGFGIIGCGVIADFHARAIAAASEASLVGVYSRSRKNTDAFAQRHGARACHSLAELLNLPEVEAICIAVPTSMHGEAALAALNHGKHVLCEKPLEVTLDKIDTMIEAARRNRRHLAAVFQSRFTPAAKLLKSAVEEGRFGRLSLCSCYVKWWRGQDYYDQGGWRGTKEGEGGGALFNQGIHSIDLLQWIAGMPVEVEARVATLAHQIEVEDTAVALVKYSSGALGVIEGTTAAWPGVSTRLEISGDRGSAVLENGKLVLWKFAEERPEDRGVVSLNTEQSNSGASDPKAIGIEGHRLHIEDLVEAIRTGRAPAIEGAEARHAVQLIRAIYEAAETRRPIAIDRIKPR